MLCDAAMGCWRARGGMPPPPCFAASFCLARLRRHLGAIDRQRVLGVGHAATTGTSVSSCATKTRSLVQPGAHQTRNVLRGAMGNKWAFLLLLVAFAKPRATAAAPLRALVVGDIHDAFAISERLARAQRHPVAARPDDDADRRESAAQPTVRASTTRARRACALVAVASRHLCRATTTRRRSSRTRAAPTRWPARATRTAARASRRAARRRLGRQVRPSRAAWVWPTPPAGRGRCGLRGCSAPPTRRPPPTARTPAARFCGSSTAVPPASARAR